MEKYIHNLDILARKKPLDLALKHRNFFDGTPEGMDVIFVGNSGLQFSHTSDPSKLEMHFVPEQNIGHIETAVITKVKYSLIFCSAFFEFYGWWKSLQDPSENSDLRYIIGKTNPQMHCFRQKLFNQQLEIYRSLGMEDQDLKYAIDLEKIDHDRDLLNKLAFYYDETVRRGFRMKE